MTYTEQEILQEVPYNPTKHFLYDLPEIVRTICVFSFLAWLSFQIFAVIVMDEIVDNFVCENSSGDMMCGANLE